PCGTHARRLPFIVDGDGDGACGTGRRSYFLDDAQERRLNVGRLGIAVGEALQDAALQIEAGEVGALIAGALARAQVAGGQQQLCEGAGAQRWVRFGAHGVAASPSLPRRAGSLGRLLALAPSPPPRGRWSSGEMLSHDSGLRTG